MVCMTLGFMHWLSKKTIVRTSLVNLPCMLEATGQCWNLLAKTHHLLCMSGTFPSHRTPDIEPLHDHLLFPLVCSPLTESTPSSSGLPWHWRPLSHSIHNQVLWFPIGLFIYTLRLVCEGSGAVGCAGLGVALGLWIPGAEVSCSSRSHHCHWHDSSLSHHTSL